MAEENPTTEPHRRDDLAYIAPMAAFMIVTWLAGYWPDWFPIAYTIKALVTAILLVVLWKNYTKIRWNHWWLGIIVGVIGVFQWIGMQGWLEHQFDFFDTKGEYFNPETSIASDQMRYAFFAIRLFGAVLVVPVMEELFWGDFLWRTIQSPNDFKLPRVGEWELIPFLIVTGAFASVHGNWWLTAIVWGAMIAGLLVYTKSIGACIIAHAVTNLLLGIYVIVYQRWDLW